MSYIQLTPEAKEQLLALKAKNGGKLIKISVEKGGCSGNSYNMNWISPSEIGESDIKIDDGDVALVCPKEAITLISGLQMDYSHDLIRGGFKFNNPNATSTCGCGKSFGT